MILSVDIETYGYCEQDHRGNPLPTQMEKKGNGRFHPAKSAFLDKPSILNATCSVTVVKGDPNDLTTWHPDTTRVYNLTIPQHRIWLASALARSHILLGHNLQFDLLFLRYEHPSIRRALMGGRQLLVDTGVLTYMQTEMRQERSLKQLAPLLARFDWDERPRDSGRYTNPSDPALHKYNAVDTEATVHVARILASRISTDTPTKLSRRSLSFYSRDLWGCIRMSEWGVPFDMAAITRLHNQLVLKLDLLSSAITNVCEHLNAPVPIMQGKNSNKTQEVMVDWILDRVPALLDHELTKRTDVEKKISLSVHNYQLLRELNSDPALDKLLSLLVSYSKTDKLVSSYTKACLYHARDPDVLTNTLIPEQPPCTTTSSNSTVYSVTPKGQQPATSEPQQKPTSSTSSVNCDPPSRPSKSKLTRLSPRHRWALTTWRTRVTRKQYRATLPPDPLTARATPAPSPLCGEPIGMSYPTWYVVPGKATDSDNVEGGTEQGRLTCKGRALQTDPRIIQGCRIARPGYHLFSYDLAQIELRIAALLSGEQSLIRAFLNGEDLHGARAIAIYGEDHFHTQYPDVPKHLRLNRKGHPGFEHVEGQVGKMVNFADLFLSGAATMQKQIYTKGGLLVPLPILQNAVSSRRTVRPQLCEWQDSLMRKADAQGYLEACPFLGQTRTMMGDVFGELRSRVVNFPVQTVAANVMRYIQQEVLALIPDDYYADHRVTLNVYDAIKGETRDPDAFANLMEEAVNRVRRSYYADLCDWTGNYVPLEYD